MYIFEKYKTHRDAQFFLLLSLFSHPNSRHNKFPLINYHRSMHTIKCTSQHCEKKCTAAISTLNKVINNDTPCIHSLRSLTRCAVKMYLNLFSWRNFFIRSHIFILLYVHAPGIYAKKVYTRIAF